MYFKMNDCKYFIQQPQEINNLEQNNDKSKMTDIDFEELRNRLLNRKN